VIEIDRDLASSWVSDSAMPSRSWSATCWTSTSRNCAAPARDARRRQSAVQHLDPLLFHLLAQRDAIADMHFMLQKEVVDRMVAPPGSKVYGRLTVMLSPWVKIERLFNVGPGAFSPPPQGLLGVREAGTARAARIRHRLRAEFRPDRARRVLPASQDPARNSLKRVLDPAIFFATGYRRRCAPWSSWRRHSSGPWRALVSRRRRPHMTGALRLPEAIMSGYQKILPVIDLSEDSDPSASGPRRSQLAITRASSCCTSR
jgi:hypothetical protein